MRSHQRVLICFSDYMDTLLLNFDILYDHVVGILQICLHVSRPSPITQFNVNSSSPCFEVESNSLFISPAHSNRTMLSRIIYRIGRSRVVSVS